MYCVREVLEYTLIGQACSSHIWYTKADILIKACHEQILVSTLANSGYFYRC